MAYVFGVNDVNKSTDSNVKPDVDKMNESIYKKIDGKTWEERLSEYSTVEQLKTLTETEAHRIFSDGQWDCATVIPGDIVKIWNTMGDEKVRDTHWYLEGSRIPLNEYFNTLNGDRTLYPGAFGIASEDINCRCWLTYERSNTKR